MHRARGKYITTWVAILAVLMMAFAPLISQAVGADAAWQEICGADGARWVSADGASNGEPAQKSAAHPLDHCPYCSLHVSVLGMPPAPLVALPAQLDRDVPPAFLAAPRTLHAWRTAQPRGPPFLA
ncbi:MAG: DUF2946 domain-containing protein [Paucibacter sp.]|nr:DUF2946 domain-containing protein [Roseateles sp.]